MGAFTFFLLLTFLTAAGHTAAADQDKISPRLRHKLTDYPQWPVIVLGRTQFLNGPDAFDRFCKENGDQKRSELRKTLIAELGKIARKEQDEIIRAAGSPKNAVRLWIVNGVGLTLTRAQVRKLAALDSVKYIYADRGTPRLKGRGKVARILKPSPSEPFALSRRKLPWNISRIGADRVWRELKVTGEGVTVAMFDSGADYTHSDLRANTWINADEIPNNGKDDDGNGLADDCYGYNFARRTPAVMAAPGKQHGTWTSGIIAGDGTGGIQTGVAPRARLMHLIAWGSYCNAGQAFQYALENGADVMNMSFSWPDLGQARGLIRRMCEQATCAGLVMVSGAGNFGKGGKNPAPVPVQLRIPEGIPCVIAAGGVDREMKVPGFCSLGPVEWAGVKFYEDFLLPGGLIKPDVCGFTGPGYPLLGTDPKSGRSGYVNPNTTIAGNSFSGPHVSGVAALMLSAAPELPAWRVKEIIEQTATPVGKDGKNSRTGAGLINAWKAVRAAIFVK
ncbi:hypothetical protein DENIS_2647 [Desulfonema ishimotonii]|uniref:Peptidase S8/S53 domain-containing protein n=2 Tax=Desulfonema ishimotonii TaxID=45657 RepID=A0A401FXK1_9BACT|nr:hypothetical protein DENIS_2647 [Desulfonema ishimotonii]